MPLPPWVSIWYELTNNFHKSSASKDLKTSIAYSACGLTIRRSRHLCSLSDLSVIDLQSLMKISSYINHPETAYEYFSLKNNAVIHFEDIIGHQRRLIWTKCFKRPGYKSSVSAEPANSEGQVRVLIKEITCQGLHGVIFDRCVLCKLFWV